MLEKKTSLRWVILAGMVLLTSCTQRVRRTYVQLAPAPARPREITLDSAAISESNRFASPTTKLFYARRKFQPAWYASGWPTATADSLISLVYSCGRYGLIPEDYFAETGQGTTHPKEFNSTESITQSEILLTNAFFSMSHHLKYGRMDFSRTTRLMQQPSADTVSLELLESILQGHPSVQNALESREPKISSYQELKKLLQNLLSKAAGRSDSSVTEDRILRLEVNMERWRWESLPLPERCVLINIPAFELQVIEGGQEVLKSRVIVGMVEKQTPQFSSNIRNFVVYPFWNVPRSIATEELLPVIQSDSGYLASHYFDVLDRKGKIIDADTVHWKNYSKNHFPFRLRQREGDDNTLGIIKFGFDNPYGVSLHDTNQKRLFRSKIRTFSHGCIRMQDAKGFAHYLIQAGNSRYSATDLELLFIEHERKEVILTKHLPILARYFTAHADLGGRVQFYPDCYNLDGTLIQALHKH